jgi:hypothetical protein
MLVVSEWRPRSLAMSHLPSLRCARATLCLSLACGSGAGNSAESLEIRRGGGLLPAVHANDPAGRVVGAVRVTHWNQPQIIYVPQYAPPAAFGFYYSPRSGYYQHRTWPNFSLGHGYYPGRHYYGGQRWHGHGWRGRDDDRRRHHWHRDGRRDGDGRWHERRRHGRDD